MLYIHIPLSSCHLESTRCLACRATSNLMGYGLPLGGFGVCLGVPLSVDLGVCAGVPPEPDSMTHKGF